MATKKKRRKNKRRHFLINSSRNPFYNDSVTYFTPTFYKPRFFSSLKNDSAVHPFIVFRKNGLTNIRNIKKKNMTWSQAKRKYPYLSPVGDYDKDGVINIYDCKPFDPKRQGPKHKKPTRKQMAALALSEKLRKAKEYDKETDLEKAMEKLKKAKREKLGIEERKKLLQEDFTRTSGASGLNVKQIMNLPEEYIHKRLGPEYEGVSILERRKERELKEREKILKQNIKKSERYEKLKGQSWYKALGGIESAQKKFQESRLTKGAKAMFTERYSPQATAFGKKAERGIYGLMGALTTSGGMIEDGADSYTNIGPGGGLARVRQKMKQTYGTGQVGRPRKSYKYGAPIQEIKAMERERKRQAAMQMLMAQQAQQQRQQQFQIQQLRQQEASMQTSQQPQMQYQQDMMNDNEAQMAFAQVTRSGPDQFVTPEMIAAQQPQQPQTPYVTAMGNPLNEQGYAPEDARSIPGSQVSEYARITQPPKKNPWHLRAKTRPNLMYNVFKNIKTNLIGGGTNLIKTRPATTITTKNTISTSPGLMNQQARVVRTQDYRFENPDESGMLA